MIGQKCVSTSIKYGLPLNNENYLQPKIQHSLYHVMDENQQAIAVQIPIADFDKNKSVIPFLL